MTLKRDNGETLFGKPVKSVGFQDLEYRSLPSGIQTKDLPNLTNDELRELSKHCNIGKAPSDMKSDIYINGTGISVKSFSSSPPAIVNHTKRPGFEQACKCTNTSISTLDSIINDYWQKRQAGLISQDISNTNQICPFYKHKKYMKPLINYFMFQGTGRGISKAPAEYIIDFINPLDVSSYRLLTKENAVDLLWSDLVFSIREKGMPNIDNSNNNPSMASIIKWTRYYDEKYKGALHIRVRNK